MSQSASVQATSDHIAPEVSAELRALAIQRSVEQLSKSYCPYSKYRVGCALLTTDDVLIGGSNVENSSYGLTICAERSAFVSAVSQGYKKFKLVAVATKDGGSCCGACRQFMREFLTPEIPILFVREDGSIAKETTMSAILPDSFGPENLLDVIE